MPKVVGSEILVKIFKVDPEEAWAEIQKIRVSSGGLASPEDIVAAAKSKDSPIHSAFEWNNQKAAHKFRLQQARSLVGYFNLVFEDGAKGPAMVSVKIADKRGYLPTEEATERHDLRAQVLKEAIAQLLAVQNRFRTLGELDAMFQVIRETAKSLGFSFDEAA